MPQEHEVLGVAADADALEIRAAFIERLRSAHPDAGGKGDGASVSELVHAYRKLRAAALRRRRTGIGSTEVAPIAMRSRRGFEIPPPYPSAATWFGRVATALVLAGSIGAAFYVASNLPDFSRRSRAEAAEPRIETAGAFVSAELEAIDEDVVRDAVAAVRSFTAHEGTAGLEEHSRRCFSVLAQSPNFRLLDYCLAFDTAATSLRYVNAEARRGGSAAFFHPGQLSARHDAALGLLFREAHPARSRHAEVEAKAVSALTRAADFPVPQ